MTPDQTYRQSLLNAFEAAVINLVKNRDDPLAQQQYDVARAALAAPAQAQQPEPVRTTDGWKTTPSKPNGAMLIAGAKVAVRDPIVNAVFVWNAMHKAAPNQAQRAVNAADLASFLDDKEFQIRSSESLANDIAVWLQGQPAQAAQGEPIMILGETLSQDQLDELWGRYPEVREYLKDKAAIKAQQAGEVVTVTSKLGDLCSFHSTSVRKGDKLYTQPAAGADVLDANRWRKIEQSGFELVQRRAGKKTLWAARPAFTNYEYELHETAAQAVDAIDARTTTSRTTAT